MNHRTIAILLYDHSIYVFYWIFFFQIQKIKDSLSENVSDEDLASYTNLLNEISRKERKSKQVTTKILKRFFISYMSNFFFSDN